MTNQEILSKAIRKAIDGGWFMDYSKAKDKWRMVPDNPKIKLTRNKLV